MQASLVVLLALSSGCASQALLASDYQTLTQTIAEAHKRQNCAPKDLAMADAHFEFAKLEFEQGNTRRAAEHLGISRDHAKVAAACASLETPKPPPVAPP